MGELVVICEQIGDLVMLKGLVECKVVCVVMFGMLIDVVLLFDKNDVYLFVMCIGYNKCGVVVNIGFVWLNFVSGVLWFVEIEFEQFVVVFECIWLVEILMLDGVIDVILVGVGVSKCVLVWYFDIVLGMQCLCDQFDVVSFDGFGVYLLMSVCGVVGVLLFYVVVM